VCQECGHAAHRWIGQCPQCESWNTLAEEVVSNGVQARVFPLQAGSRTGNVPQPLSQVELGAETRIRTRVQELDRVLGGGIMHGSLILLAGEPGIGKSTLMTELGKYLPERKVLYVTGEESVRQVKLRAERLGVDSEGFLLLSETNIESIVDAAQRSQPDVMVVDSIQTVFRPDIQSAPGSVSQVRESAAALMHVTKQMDFPTFLVGHVTKQGAIAGPRVLEHLVDTVLHFEGDRHHAFRILRSVKNRFGAANEIGVFEMRESGLREVQNPSEIFLSERGCDVSGSSVVCSMEGTRPVLVEIQALVTETSYGTPQRTATGFDAKRLQMLLAVLEKREGFRLSAQDVFVNAAGGVRLDEPAVDLGVMIAVASSFRDLEIDRRTLFVGEVGLGGELRSVGMIEARLKEAARLGFQRALIPGRNAKQPFGKALEIVPAATVHDVLDLVL
jgi:DNA repair protein RadA/Sms